MLYLILHILSLLHLKTWSSYGRCVDLRYPLALKMKAQEIVQIEGSKDMKTLKNHLTSYGNGLLFQGSAWIEV
jgi:hypothetical protein